MTNSSSRPHISHIPLSASPIRWKLCVQLVYANLASFHGRISTWIHPSLWSGWTCSWLIASLSTTDYPLTQQKRDGMWVEHKGLVPIKSNTVKKRKKRVQFSIREWESHVQSTSWINRRSPPQLPGRRSAYAVSRHHAAHVLPSWDMPRPVTGCARVTKAWTRTVQKPFYTYFI